MQAETLRLRQDGESIECWDDDGELQCTDDIQFHAVSAATSVTGSIRRSGHRDSISSRRSARSDLESNAGDEDWQVLLRDNDETATEEAIASAHSAGIPIPSNVPRSALLGGTIKKLGGKKAKGFIDDWSEDLELPGADGELALKAHDEQAFPETLRQVSSSLSSPVKSRTSVAVGSPLGSPTAFPQSTAVSPSNKHRDDNDTFEGQDVPTIKVAQSRSLQTLPLASLAGSPEGDDDAEDFEKDFELPADDSLLKLSQPKDIIDAPSQNVDDLDIEWAEGSIGVRFGGTKRDGRSTHSSSVSALSPSLSSCLTGESEDDVLDGLVLPDGPLNLEESLKRRQETRISQSGDYREPKKMPNTVHEDSDFFAGLEIGDGNVFTSSKPTLNQNIKRKIARPSTPTRSAKTITFTNKPAPGGTRIPRLSGHDRSHSNLEPVSESGAPISKFRRPHSRLAGHSTHPSISSTGTSSPPSTPSAVGRRSLGSGNSREGLRSDPTTTSPQHLKTKRSMPAIRAAQPSPPTLPFQRPPSRQDGSNRQPSVSVNRPKTPVDRTTTDSRLSLNRRPQVPFLPAGSSQSQSHHVSVKFPRHLRRPDSDSSGDMMTLQRSMSRISGLPRPNSPGRSLRESGNEALAAAAKRTITRPTRRRNFGDGTELEAFDDLPTSASVESRFVKSPVGHGAPRSLRSRLGQATGGSPSRTGTPVPSNHSPSRPQDFTPRFARDTTASRIAREQRIASLSVPIRDREGGPLVPLSTNWKAQGSSRGTDTILSLRSKRGKTAQTPGSRPHLIRPMGSGVNEARSVKGMRYNPVTCRWEGNENAIAEFDAICSPKSPKAAPALITSVGAMQGVQIVGDMVFDPQRMCWLKLAPIQPGNNVVAVVRDECDDVFAGLDDLQEKPAPRHRRTVSSGSNELDGSAGWDDQSGGDSSEEWPITEEFDVGPEFIKRQRAEEEKWRRKVAKWVSPDRRRLGDSWRWAIRDLVSSGGVFGTQWRDSA
ncbi:hypothetical protein VTN77DRAFT_3283 [Rasamsonia byssochlamydoides]|uniref:uncharacterized protein n=1 Tax=Rasamsonia byssochlamydoides TaxID=89139 RepID=UPI0037427E49